jgi:sensor histidine kinase YesM
MVRIDRFDKRTNRTVITINIVAVILFLCLPLLFIPLDNARGFNIYIRIVSSIFPILFVFYFNFFFLIAHLLVKRRWKWYILSNIIVSALISLISIKLFPDSFSDIYDIPKAIIFGRDLFLVIITATLAVAIRMTIEWYRTENAKAKLEAVASQAELKNLKSQLNPHFLFNTLNNIYSLIAIDRDKAQRSVLGISKILRYVLYDNNQDKVPLHKELLFTKSYIELMSLRLTEKTDVITDITEETDGTMIAPLMFISLIENAFKHGVSHEEHSFIDINIRLADNKVICTVKNSYFPKSQNDYSGSGIGIANLKRRLELLYPKKHKYEISITEKIYSSILIIETD